MDKEQFKKARDNLLIQLWNVYEQRDPVVIDSEEDRQMREAMWQFQVVREFEADRRYQGWFKALKEKGK